MRHKTDSKHPRGKDWQRIHAERFNCSCAKCGKRGQKKSMPALYIRKEHDDSMRILCRLCDGCMSVHLDELGVKMPE